MTDDGSAAIPAPSASAANPAPAAAPSAANPAPASAPNPARHASADAPNPANPTPAAAPNPASPTPAAAPTPAAGSPRQRPTKPAARPDDSTPTTPPSVRALPRPRDLRKASTLGRVSMVVFVIGAIAIVLEVVLYASGVRGLPLWFNLLWLLLPIGFVLGLLNAYIEARKSPN